MKMLKPVSRGLIALLAASALAFPLPASADQKGNKPGNQEKKDNEKVRDAQKDVSQAREKLNDAQQELRRVERELDQAEAKEKAAVRGIQAAREKAEERLGKTIGYDRALVDQKEAQVAFDRLKAPLIAALRERPDYRAALDKADAAMEKLRTLRMNTTISDDDRKSQHTELTKLTSAPSAMEQVAIAEDETASAAKKRLGELQEKVAALKERLRKEVDSESDVRSAKGEAEKAQNALKRARDAAIKERRQFAQAEQNLAEKQAHLQKAQAQDRKNDGKKGKDK